MPRASRSKAKRARHKKWLKRAKGFRGRRRRVFKLAKEAVLKAGQHAYHDRRKKKTNKRQLWQVQINAAVRQHGLSYSRFIASLRRAKVSLDRKVLAEIARKHPTVFGKIVAFAQNSQHTKSKKQTIPKNQAQKTQRTRRE